MSAPMVRAILEGRKTQTRRALKRQFLDVLPINDKSGWLGLIERQAAETKGKGAMFRCRYGVPGDELWVRETWAQVGTPGTLGGHVRYKADEDRAIGAYGAQRWKPSIHMRRIDSRITLRISEVRCQLLHDIKSADAAAEGWPGADEKHINPVSWYAELWESINGKGSWDANPWVWAISFEMAK